MCIFSLIFIKSNNFNKKCSSFNNIPNIFIKNYIIFVTYSFLNSLNILQLAHYNKYKFLNNIKE